MKGIGAILAGGRSERFGSDKAVTLLDGRRLVDWVADALAPQVTQIVFCGRDEPGRHCLADRPESGIGPLGGLAAALHYAAKNDAEFVLSAGCDTPDIPADLREQRPLPKNGGAAAAKRARKRLGQVLEKMAD